MSDSSFNYPGGGYYISAASLILEFRNFIDSHPVFYKLNEANSCWPKITVYCSELAQHSDIMKAVTRIHLGSQIDFERALFCSWGSLLVARSLNLIEQHQRTLFFAGLLQDLGKHSLSSEIKDVASRMNGHLLSKRTDQYDEQIHPLLGSIYLEELLPDVDGVNDLVLNHHARDDGTGYPSHISESQLKIDNQILIIANEISDRLDQLGGHNQIAKILPNLKLSRLLYFAKAHDAWLTLLEPYVSQNVDNEESVLSQDGIRVKRDNLEKLLSCLLCVSSELVPYDFDLTVHGLRSMIRKLASLFTDSGMFDRQSLASDTKVPLNVLSEMSVLLEAMPEILARCMHFVDEILASKKYDSSINVVLLTESRELLRNNIKTLDRNRCSIFR